MSVAIGAALTKKLNGENTVVYSLHGDGELDEGQNWEAMMFAAHHKVDNLISTVDWNGQQIDGPTKKVMNLLDLGAKFDAFGWEVIRLEKGNDVEEVAAALEKAKSFVGKGKPIVILMVTVMAAVLTSWKALTSGMVSPPTMSNWPKHWHNCQRPWEIINA